MFEHYSVLNKETVDSVLNDLSGVYVDGTLGGAGHTLDLLSKLKDDSVVIGLDQDMTAINNAKENIDSKNFIAIHTNFENLKSELNKVGIFKINGLILDLGFSSPQVDNPERGFSYMQDGPLDMRMNLEQDFKAYDIVNNYTKEDLNRIFLKYGEEKNANFISSKIVAKRVSSPINSTLELVDIIEESIPFKIKNKINSHIAKKVFQALRIEVNSELKVLDKVLDDAFDMLVKGGRISVITFHSLEDKLVKHKFKSFSEINSDLNKLPIIPEELQPKGSVITRKPILPTGEEILQNSRSKSAKLRVVEKINEN